MKKIIFYLVVAISLTSCVEVLDISLEDSEKMLVLNGILYPDSLVKVNLSKSINSLDGDAFVRFINDAKVELYKDSVFVEQLQYDTNGYYIGQTKPILGKNYTIKVVYENKPELSATTTIPSPVQIKDIQYDIPIDSSVQTWIDPETGEQFDTVLYSIGEIGYIYVTIDDPINENNYYLVSATYDEPQYIYTDDGQVFITGYIERSFYITLNGTENEGIADNYYYFEGSPQFTGDVFSDVLFNGNEKNLKIQFNTWLLNNILPIYEYDESGMPFYDGSDLSDVVLYIHLFTLSKEMFDFIVSYDKYQSVNGNPFAEPVNIYTNIINGVGILGGANCFTDTLRFN